MANVHLMELLMGEHQNELRREVEPGVSFGKRWLVVRQGVRGLG